MPRTFRSKTLAGRVRAAGTRMPESEACLLRTLFCLPWTGVAVTVACKGGRFDAMGYGLRLAELKSDLREALSDVQAHEREIAAPLVQARRLAREELEVGLKDLLQEIEQEKRTRGR